MTSVEQFCKAPSGELLNLCSKKQLWEIINLYELSGIDKRLRKDELRQVVRNKLGGRQVLSIIEEQETPGASPVVMQKSVVSLVGLSFEQQKELLDMQQTHEKEMREQEIEVEKLKLNNVARQREMDFEKMKHDQKLAAERQNQEFQLKLESLKLRGEGRPISPTDGSFNLINNLKLLPVFNESDPDVFFHYLKV